MAKYGRDVRVPYKPYVHPLGMYQDCLRLFSIPTSSAASERAWSVFSMLHTKRRNRLKNSTVIKMAYIYINSSLLDSLDRYDYARLMLQDDDEDDDEDNNNGK